MSSVLCPYCHTPVAPSELEAATTSAGRYLICPECDVPFPVMTDLRRPDESGHLGDENDA